ncbi:hypothetical protein [Sabulicella glaciei]|uniref:Uncharacterized protein n=1 Tax=Sabulicella glaciei TaxID=2984948 RepID=A0ABT3NQR7_9PROT|nr:hypothetical protein [Roseococcus sp. MDT2-1-1]MCW8084492.1 hypothetical protein [Roseococcus sp. MDT2-1-1]
MSLHRVRAPTAKRFPVAFFCNPNPDAPIAAIPSCIGPGNPPNWLPITAAGHLRPRLGASKAHRRVGAGG